MLYPRSNLGQSLARALRGQDPFNDAPNGLFLAAPRRTGKSTFLQADLQPALEAAGVLVIYVDLWADRQREAEQLIRRAIAEKLEPYRPIVHRALRAVSRKTGIKGTDAGGIIQLDLDTLDSPGGASLPEALQALHRACGKPVALIIDEAQQALLHASGQALMAALKSARDQMNRPGSVNLMLVLSGSDRDKLLRLTNSRAAAFYGSQITTLPTLDRDYIAHVSRQLTQEDPSLAPMNESSLWQAFEAFGHRPQFFATALGQALTLHRQGVGPFEIRVREAAEARQVADEAQMRADYLGLGSLGRAVLWRLLATRGEFRPYDEEALKFYRQKHGRKVSPAQVQNALNQLRDHTPSLAWKSNHGDYAVEDGTMYAWYERLLAKGTWPPTA